MLGSAGYQANQQGGISIILIDFFKQIYTTGIRYIVF